MWGITRLDFGISMWTGRPVAHEIAIRLELSVELALMATLIAVMIAVPLGTLAAFRHDRWVDYCVRVFSIAGLAVPSFWLGIVMILAFIIYFRWLPPLTFTPLWVDPKANLSQLIWPALAVGYRYAAVATRMTRSAVLEVLREDYIRTARAKGLREETVLFRHALKNALLPIVTVIGLEFAFLISGLVVTEQVFNLNGIGKLFVEAISQRDYTMVQSLVLLTAFVFIFVNFIVDLINAYLDPRVRYQ
jgi:peptide/nickel transport system permease protein